MNEWGFRPLPSRHRILKFEPRRSEAERATSRSEGPHNIGSLRVRGKPRESNIFVSLKPEGQNGGRARDL